MYKAKKSAQEAHEAIRPSLRLREPSSIKEYLHPNQLKLYQLIWNRFIASQMESSLNLTTSVDIGAGRCMFRATGSKVLFDGFTRAYQQDKKQDNLLPVLNMDEVLHLINLDSSQHFTNPPPRFSDASFQHVCPHNFYGHITELY
jgi:DNA topoisomerase-1